MATTVSHSKTRMLILTALFATVRQHDLERIEVRVNVSEYRK